ncbi:hypothetical protein IF1G_10169 [Cordyceps javanica]|uniref:Uncharacterized protein n=1 Tax=Cordyceps javanica TaxID=43265 RepID=A0A545VMM4_9HYPO|nr:hypothetical protein IF1G_10169 [Cordyceps javanica]TQW02916.1 hypothetical protein IF2G_09433 [Cordyceps javanica]
MGTQRDTHQPPPAAAAPSHDSLRQQQQELVNLTYKSGKYAACTAVAIVFAPLTLGAMLFVLPLLFKPQFAIHSCRRCGLRLAITTGGLGDYGFTIAADVSDANFAPAEDDWRPDLARLPGGMRVARSPLGPRPEISDREMKTCSKRFAALRAKTRVKLVSDDWQRGPVRCMIMTGPDRRPASLQEWEAGEGEVFCQIHLNNVVNVGSYANSDANIRVTMRGAAASLPLQAAASDKDQPPPPPPPPHTAAGSDGSPPDDFAETCLIRLFPGDNYSVSFHTPSSRPPAYSARSPSACRPAATVNVSPVPKRFRTQFWGGMPIWRWKSTEGNLLWVSRRFRDADMSALNTTLCLVDDYERLVAVVDGWESRRVAGAAPAPAAPGPAGSSGGLLRECRLKLYADLDTGVLGEILGSYCALLVQVRRATKELKREDDEKRSSY